MSEFARERGERQELVMLLLCCAAADAAGLLIKFMHPECPTEAATQGVSVCVCVCVSVSVCVCVINAQLLKLLMKNDF